MEGFKEGTRIRFKTKSEVTGTEIEKYNINERIFESYGGVTGTIKKIGETTTVLQMDDGGMPTGRNDTIPIVTKKLNTLPEELFEL